jgi:hypothetical protein
MNKNLDFEFNKNGGLFDKNLEEKERNHLEMLKENEKLTLNRKQQDYERHKDKRILEAEKKLRQEQEHRMRQPRPKGVPPLRLLSWQEIRSKAKRYVEKAHEQDMKETRESFEAARNKVYEAVENRIKAERQPTAENTSLTGKFQESKQEITEPLSERIKREREAFEARNRERDIDRDR